MNDDALHALRIETEFLAGVESNFRQTGGQHLHGTIWRLARDDDETTLRALLASHHRQDRKLLKQLPCNRRILLYGSERRWLLGKRRASVVIASVLAPLEHCAAGVEGAAPPADLGALVDHVRDLVTDPELPHVIGVCSPSGFTPEARGSQLELPNVTLVLIEPQQDASWHVTGVSENASEHIQAFFDPETTSRQFRRVADEIDECGADMSTHGLSARTVAARLGLPKAVVVKAFEQAALADATLRVTRRADEVALIRRESSVQESTTLAGVIDHIRALFDRSGRENEKITLLTEQRAELARRRDRLYEDIAKLETREAELLEQGRRTPGESARRRVAGKLAQLRRDIARQNTLANMLNSQIEIVATHIHNLTLIQQGRAVELPDSAELTQHAVQAAEMLEELEADSQLAAQAECRVDEEVGGDEERAILREFDSAAEPDAKPERLPSEPPPQEEQRQSEASDSDRRPAADHEA